MPLEALERDIAALGGALTRQLALWLALVAEFDRRDGGRRWGFSGTARWLAWRCGLGARAAREHVRVARRLGELRSIQAAFARGELSYSKVRALTRAEVGDDELALLELARRSTADQLEQAVRSRRSAPSSNLEATRQAHERRRLDWWWELDGSLGVRGRLAPDDGAAFTEAVDAAAETLHGAREPALHTEGATARPGLGACRADAIAEIVQSGAPRTQVVLHVDTAALACTATTAEARAGEVCSLRDGPAIPSETARRLSCDGEVTIARPDGRLDHGRSRRVVSAALRTSLERRDGGCRFPGCDRRHGLHAHHIEHWVHGGRTDRDNLVLLCRYHHRLVHEEGFTVRRRGGEVRFHRPDEQALTDLPPPVPVASAA